VRVHLGERDGDAEGIAAGFDLTEAGTKKGLAVYCVRDPAQVPGVARLGPDPWPRSSPSRCSPRCSPGPDVPNSRAWLRDPERDRRNR